MRPATLVTASCTTGWLDWIHSELWLFDDGLLVTKTNLARTIANGLGPTVGSAPTTRGFTREDIAAITAANRSNTWVADSSLAGATFTTGSTTGRVDLELELAGRRRTLLWLQTDRADAALREAFVRWGVQITN